MASIQCRVGGTTHTHTSVAEVRACAGFGTPTVPVSGPVVSVTVLEIPTPAQLRYVGFLRGDIDRATLMSKRECSEYINELKARPHRAAATHVSVPGDGTKVPLSLLELVPNGRYAVRSDATEPYIFMRVHRPTWGRYNGSCKIQTQHGDKLSLPKFVIWYSGKVSVYDRSIEDSILLLICDYRGAALAYSREIGRCCRCGKELTVERSRYYGIGPECEEFFPWVIEAVDEERAMKVGV